MARRSVDTDGEEIPEQYERDAHARLFELPQFHCAVFPLAVRALSDDGARRQLREQDNEPPTTEDDERLRAMTFEDIWSRAVLNAYHARLALRIAATQAPACRESGRGQCELQFWRDRIKALDDALLGLVLARQRIAAATSTLIPA